MASLFDDNTSLFDFVAKTGNGIKGLVDSGISKVPEIYIQPPSERVEIIDEKFSSVPIDLSKLDGPEHDQVAEAIVRASETLGFFQVINHGVNLELLESLKDAAHRFFAQPPDSKAVYMKGVSPSPLVKYETSFAPENEKVLQWKDFLSMFYTNDVDANKYWPKECKEEALKYVKLSTKMITRLLEVLIKNLGVELDNSRIESLIVCRAVNMNFYPPCPNPELTIGAARHSDMGILTVLLQDEIGGLYVKAVEEDILAGKKEEWVEIPSIHGALVINVGDSLQILSNDRYKSAEHKVRNKSNQSRVSIPLFFAPRLTDKIGPLPELVDRDGRALYKEVLTQDFLNTYLKRPYEGKKSLDFAKIN